MVLVNLAIEMLVYRFLVMLPLLHYERDVVSEENRLHHQMKRGVGL